MIISLRRAMLLETASRQFSISGMNATTTAALAKAAGVSEPLLYVHFEDKRHMFREAVKANVDARLRALDLRLSAVVSEADRTSVSRAAEATIIGCVSSETSAILTNWALLEDPDYGAELHRNEVAAVTMLWDREFARKIPEARGEAICGVEACLAFGFWLAALRHTPETAAPLARQFAVCLEKLAISSERQSRQNRVVIRG